MEERNANLTSLDALAPPELGSAGETDVEDGEVVEPGVGDVAVICAGLGAFNERAAQQFVCFAQFTILRP